MPEPAPAPLRLDPSESVLIMRALDARPLAELVEGRGGLEGTLPDGFLNTTSGRTVARAFYRGRARGYYTLLIADLLAVELLGITPFEVWGDDWLTGGTLIRDLVAAAKAAA